MTCYIELNQEVEEIEPRFQQDAFGIPLWNLNGYLDPSAMGETCVK